MDIDEWFFAVWMNDVDKVSALSQLNAGRTDETGQSALMYAAQKGFIDIVKILTPKEQGMCDQAGRTALMLSIIFSQFQIVPLLLEEAGVQDNDGWTAAMHCIAQEDVSSLDMLIGKEMLIRDLQDRTILHLAVQLNKPDFVVILAEHKELLGLTDQYGSTSLLYAVQMGNLEMVNVLLSEAGKVNNNGIYALKLAIQTNQYEIIDLLTPLEEKLNINTQKNQEDDDNEPQLKIQENNQEDNEDIKPEEVEKMLEQLGINKNILQKVELKE